MADRQGVGADAHRAHAHHGEPVGASHVDDTEQFDREIHIRPIALTAAGLVAVMVISAVAMWGLLLWMQKLEDRQDRPLSPLPEARQRQLPPEPRLQADPDLDMQELRAVEERLLTEPGWVDPRRGKVRLPIDLAIDVLARRGLPSRPPEQVPGQSTPGRSAPGRRVPGQPPPPVPELGDPEKPPLPSGGLLP